MTLADYTHLNELAESAMRILRREVRHVRLFSSADGREHQLYALVYVIVVIVWTASMVHRTMQKGVRQAAVVCSGLLVGWGTVRAQVPDRQRKRCQPLCVVSVLPVSNRHPPGGAMDGMGH